MRAKKSRYHLILSPPRGSDLNEYCPGDAESQQSQYSLAVTGNPVAAYSTKSFGAQLAKCIQIITVCCLAAPDSSLKDLQKTLLVSGHHI